MTGILSILCSSVLLWAAILLPFGVPLPAFCWAVGFLVLVSFPALCCLAVGNREMSPVDVEPLQRARSRPNQVLTLAR
jgi:hypothetical protein